MGVLIASWMNAAKHITFLVMGDFNHTANEKYLVEFCDLIWFKV